MNNILETIERIHTGGQVLRRNSRVHLLPKAAMRDRRGEALTAPHRVTARRRGFTLVEIMVVVVLGMLVFGIGIKAWRQYAFEIARSTLKQKLQQEARRVMQQLAADVRSADASGMNVVPGTEPDQPGFSRLQLARVFFRPEGNTTAPETAHPIEYELVPPVLRRTGPLTPQQSLAAPVILGTHVKDCQIVQATASATLAAPSAPPAPAASARLSSGTQGLEIVLTMSGTVPGSRVVVWHVERTSVFPRTALSQNQNPGVRSISSLASHTINSSPNAGFFDSFEAGALLTAERLAELGLGDLRELRNVQTNNIDSAESLLSQINEAIANSRPSETWGSWFAGWLRDTNIEISQDMGREISDADTVAELEPLQARLATFTQELGRTQIGLAFGESGSSGSPPDSAGARELAQRREEILKLKMKDRVTRINSPDAPTYEDQLREQLNAAGTRESWESQEAWNTRRERAQQMMTLYEQCNLSSILGGGSNANGSDVGIGAETDDYKALEYGYSCQQFASSKLAILKNKEVAEQNVQLIDEELRRRGA
jgi:prepilin-type N-terminal cleavage/methylation domain-containing protein